MIGEKYWKPLDQVFSDYFNHPESKFDGNSGIHRRKHQSADRIIYIGKEANKIEETNVLSEGDEDYDVHIPTDKKKNGPWKTFTEYH
jgi:hypothetical protein